MAESVIVAQGDEILTGQTLDTNSHWLVGRLWNAGVPVRRILAAPDRLDDLTQVLREAAALAPAVVCTGGLGPTRDDWTSEAAARAFGRTLEHREEAWTQIVTLFASRSRTPTEADRKQARLPEGARVLKNDWGTAPGFVLEADPSVVWFLPGPPREMRPMFEAHVLPDLVARFAPSAPVLHTVRVVGVAEAALEERLRGIDGVDVGFRAWNGEVQVKLRFSPTVAEETRAAVVREVVGRIGPAAWGVDCGDLAEEVGVRLVAREETLAVAESCTAGALSAWIGSVPGASRYFVEGAVTYANEAKVRACGVDPATIAEHGAVSEAVARAMAEGIRARAGTTWGIGVTGIAGPSGGTPDKPVGSVHVAVAGPDGTDHRLLRFSGDRERIQRWTATAALAKFVRRLA